MKFPITQNKYWYSNESKEKLEKLGFTFEQTTERYKNFGEWQVTDCKPTIEISTIEELIEFTKEYGEIVFNGKTIEIYNDYRE
jgi:hypothetical protein